MAATAFPAFTKSIRGHGRSHKAAPAPTGGTLNHSRGVAAAPASAYRGLAIPQAPFPP